MALAACVRLTDIYLDDMLNLIASVYCLPLLYRLRVGCWRTASFLGQRRSRISGSRVGLIQLVGPKANVGLIEPDTIYTGLLFFLLSRRLVRGWLDAGVACSSLVVRTVRSMRCTSLVLALSLSAICSSSFIETAKRGVL